MIQINNLIYITITPPPPPSLKEDKYYKKLKAAKASK